MNEIKWNYVVPNFKSAKERKEIREHLKSLVHILTCYYDISGNGKVNVTHPEVNQVRIRPSKGAEIQRVQYSGDYRHLEGIIVSSSSKHITMDLHRERYLIYYSHRK